MTDIPVRPELIVWARNHRGLTQEAAAEKLSVSVEELAALEAGEKTPNLTFFKRLSARLRIPGGALLRQSPPDVPPAPADFRTIEGRDPSLGFETRLAISYARTIAANYLELLEHELTDRMPDLPTLSLSQNPEDAGEAERTRIGVSSSQQIGWTSDQGFRNWRTIIESAGTLVLLKNFPLEDCKGFTIFDDVNAPVIVISKEERLDVARTFTLVHEYAHILLRQPGLSDHDDRNPVEAFCNRFAAAFLMPRETIRQLLGSLPNAPVDWAIDDVRTFARRLKVSQQALALRFESIGIAPAGFFNRVRQLQGRVRPSRPQSGGNYVNTQVNELGDAFTSAVLRAESNELIRPTEASEMLDIRPVHFERIRDQIDNQRARVGTG